MKTIKIDGKEYVEFNKLKFQNRRMILSIIIMILIAIFIGLMIFSINTLVKEKELIKSDPLVYGMEQHGFYSCECIDNSGLVWQSAKGGFKSEVVSPWKID